MRTEFKAAIIVCLTFLCVWALINVAVNRNNIVIEQTVQQQQTTQQPMVNDSDTGFGASYILYMMMFFIWLCIGVTGAYIIYAILTKKWKSLRNIAILFISLWVFFFVLDYSSDAIRQLLHKGFSFERPAGSNGTGTQNIQTTLVPIAAVLIIIFWVVLLIFIIFAILKNTKKRTITKSSKEKVSDAISTAIDEMRAGGEYRKAILRCYRRFCKIISDQGISQQDSLTPKELEYLIQKQLAVPREPLKELTLLFEEARYSVHEIQPQKKDIAIECLLAIKKSLDKEVPDDR